MPFVLIILGLLLLIVAIRGTQGDAFSLIKSEFTGTNSFVVFASAIAILGALAYIKPFRPIGFAMIGLIVLGMILTDKGGFFAKLNDALRNPVAPSTGSAIGGNVTGSMTDNTAFGAVQLPTVTTPQGHVMTIPFFQSPTAPGSF
jgi:hypothetical protein